MRTDFEQEGLPDQRIQVADRADAPARPGASHVDDEDFVTTVGQLLRQMSSVIVQKVPLRPKPWLSTTGCLEGSGEAG